MKSSVPSFFVSTVSARPLRAESRLHVLQTLSNTPVTTWRLILKPQFLNSRRSYSISLEEFSPRQ